MFGKPPEAVPDELNAREYLILARWYRESSMIAQARLALNRCLELEPEGANSHECKRMLSNFPKVVLPPDIVLVLQKAEALSRNKKDQAQGILNKLKSQFPDSEPVLRVQALVYLHQGDIDNCFKSLEECFAINPDYSPALETMARALIADMNYPDARSYLQRSLAASPESNNLQELQRAYDTLASWE